MNDAISLEQAQQQLQEVLDCLQDENTPLETALQEYARAAELLAQCKELLQKAQITVDEIDEKFGSLEVNENV